ncbi:MAG: Eco57I restriction-modification methylase domain-containing protein [Actinomycetota bacterium]
MDKLSTGSSFLWDRFKLLVKAMRNGNPALGVPAYNGALFASDGFAGAGTLEVVEISDPDFAEILMGLGLDPQEQSGIDYSTLEIGHLGNIYEGLLSLNLSLADTALHYDARADTYVAANGGSGGDGVEAGDLVWLAHEGGRKSGGVYYTPSSLVKHLINHSVLPAFQAHLEGVRELASTDPDAAADKLLDFAVLDPACGSAHFLVAVVNELADRTTRFLAEVPLPKIKTKLEGLRAGPSPGIAVDDVALIRRLVMKRCVYGVDLSPMGVEVAKISLWLASFVPGLTLAYLDRNIVVGNSLVGIARPENLRPSGAAAQAWFLEDALVAGLSNAAAALREVAEGDDRNPEEIARSRSADRAAQQATASLTKLFNLWTADAFGLAGGRQEVELHGPEVLEGRSNGLTDDAGRLADEHSFLHWPLIFPHVFVRPNPGFDAVIGNPPWEELTVEALAFYALFAPGIRGLSDSRRKQAISELLGKRPELAARHAALLGKAKSQRTYFTKSGEYVSLAGDPDLYKFFCQRYARLIRDGGMLGVVLPRNAFAALGSEGFRSWLFGQNTCRRLDFLLNSGRWAFDSEPRYTVALVAAQRALPPQTHLVRVAATASSAEQWERQSASEGLAWNRHVFGPGWRVPLLRNEAEARVWAKLRNGSPFPLGSSGRWKCFPVAEFHETKDKAFWENAFTGRPLWKGESFDQYDPHGAEARWCPESEAVRRVVRKPRPGSGSALSKTFSLADRRRAVLAELEIARVAFRDVTRATDSRTTRACLIPPKTFLTNKAPYLAFVEGSDLERAACLGLMNSLPFDWQARRCVEINLNYFILEGLVLPNLKEDDLETIGHAAARLSCVDNRFEEFAKSTGVECGPLAEDERTQLRVEIDCLVARAWGLTEEDLSVVFSDFTPAAVPPAYREAVLRRLRQL